MSDASIEAEHWIGRVRLVSVELGRARWRPQLVEQDRPVHAVEEDERGRAWIGFSLLVVHAPSAVIVVDPGLDDGHSPWLARSFEDCARTATIGEALAAAGVSADQVAHVVFTHAHRDHLCGAVRERDGTLEPLFRRAIHHLRPEDHGGGRYGGCDDPEVRERLAVLAAAGLLRGDAAGLPVELHLTPTPGESPGHQVVWIRDGGEVGVALGDLFHLPSEIAHLDWSPRGRNAAELLRSRVATIESALRDEALCHLHHALPTPFGRLRRVASGVRWEPVGG